MRGAFGALHWTPAVFWSSTLTEFMQAIAGFNEANSSDARNEAPSEDEVEDLVKRYG